MSHTMNIATQFNDSYALQKACEKLNLKTEKGSYSFYSNDTKHTGTAVFLPNWKYPIVITNFEKGDLAYDNYNENWGSMTELKKLEAYYGAEKATQEARKMGYSVYESFNEKENEIELTINLENNI